MATLEDYDANVVDLVPCLVKDVLNELSNTTMELATENEIKEAKEYMLKRGLATLLLIGADCATYGAMKNQMQQNMAIDENNLNTFAKTSKAGNGKIAQKDLSDVTCYHCGKKGKFARTCLNKNQTVKLMSTLKLLMG